MFEIVSDPIQPYDSEEEVKTQSRTDYWKWYHGDRISFPVYGFSDSYQPPLLLLNQEIPSFHEGFIGNMFDTTTFISELYLQK